MNKTLLLIIIDFLFLNLIALTRWEKAEPVRAQHPPVPSVGANAATQDQDLVAAMRQSLTDEQSAREALAQKLAGADQTLSAREQTLAEIQAERVKLAATLAETQGAAAQLNREIAAARNESSLTKDQLAQLQRELADKIDEARRQHQQIAELEQYRGRAEKQIEGLTVAVVVGEAEKQHLQTETAKLETQVQAERNERMKVQESTAKLAQGVGQLTQKSGELAKEIRDNRPINANVLYSDFLANRAQAIFTAARKGMFGQVNRSKETPTVFTTDGRQVYALLHIADTVFSLWDPNYDWDKVGISFSRPPAYRTPAAELVFLALDPRVVVVPVDASQVAAIGAKVYPIAADPFKFPDAVLVSGNKGYGEVGFKLDPTEPGYVRVDNRFFKRLFGDFSPSRGDLVFSHTGELLGIMVNNDYCSLVKDFTPLKTIRTGDGTGPQHTGELLDGIAARVQGLPLKLQ